MSEDKADGSGYEKLEKNKNETHSRPRAETLSELCLPEDKYRIIYFLFMLGGMAFLIPYNCFIMATDYFKSRFPDNPVVFDMSLVYIVTALVTVLGNNLLVDVFSMSFRYKFGYSLSFATLCYVLVFEIYYELEIASSYTANLVGVAIVAIGCTIQQSSFYGYSSMLPSKYTYAVMVGESAAGVFASLVCICTRFLINDLRVSTITFFGISYFLLVIWCILYPRIEKSDFVRFYTNLCERSKTKITLEPREDAGLIEVCDSRYGVLKIQTSPPGSSNILSFANPVYEPNDQSSRPTYKVEDVLFTGRSINHNSTMGLSAFKDGLRARWNVTRTILPYMMSICLVYFTTLCVYPGFISEIESCHMGSWMPMLVMAEFNCADIIGKVVTPTKHWTGFKHLKCAIARLIMIPLMILCVTPYWHLELFSCDLLAFTYSIVLGFSNGYLGSIPMIQAPTKVSRCYRELAGNLMTLFYMWGLATGSLGAYSLEKIIRPMRTHHDCDYRNPPVTTFKPYPTQYTGELTSLSSTPSIFITTILSSLSTINSTESI